jgi:geranylgeranyl diphosphate/geranylgeranyl-bacteriochlorophyllide a reductase
MYDIAIIGAGPAGATLARLIGRQYKTLLIDKGPIVPSEGQ